MHRTTPLVCAVATFVLITDHMRAVAARENSQLSRAKRDDDKYTTDYDDFDVDQILISDRLMKSYIKCLQNKGPCTKEGRELKKYLPDALATDCSKCSEVQKKQGGKVLAYILQFYRDDFEELVEIYDPEGIFKAKYAYGNAGDDDEGDDA